eukprot:1158994-Pelagomonas_calceolata.AAC.7
MNEWHACDTFCMATPRQWYKHYQYQYQDAIVRPLHLQTGTSLTHGINITFSTSMLWHTPLPPPTTSKLAVSCSDWRPYCFFCDLQPHLQYQHAMARFFASLRYMNSFQPFQECCTHAIVQNKRAEGVTLLHRHGWYEAPPSRSRSAARM